MNITVTLALSPSPSRNRTVPSPYFEWRTRWPFLRLAAPVGSGRSIAGRGEAPGLRDAGLSAEEAGDVVDRVGGLPAALPGLPRSYFLEWIPGRVQMGLARAVIHEAMKGLEEVALAPWRPLPPWPAGARGASWLSSS